MDEKQPLDINFQMDVLTSLPNKNKIIEENYMNMNTNLMIMNRTRQQNQFYDN